MKRNPRTVLAVGLLCFFSLAFVGCGGSDGSDVGESGGGGGGGVIGTCNFNTMSNGTKPGSCVVYSGRSEVSQRRRKSSCESSGGEWTEGKAVCKKGGNFLGTCTFKISGVTHKNYYYGQDSQTSKHKSRCKNRKHQNPEWEGA